MTDPISTLSAIPMASVPSAQGHDDRQEAAVRQSATEFEAVFVKQMLQYAGLADAFGMEADSPIAPFADFILERVATDIVEKGGFGLGEQFYDHLNSQSAPEEESSEGVRL